MMGISGGSMNALLTAGARMEQASMQGRVANNVRANANILRAEIKQDAGRGASVEKKENALKEMEEKADAVENTQFSSLSEVRKSVEQAAEINRQEAKEEAKKAEKKQEEKAKEKKAEETKEEKALSEKGVNEESSGEKVNEVQGTEKTSVDHVDVLL